MIPEVVTTAALLGFGITCVIFAYLSYRKDWKAVVSIALICGVVSLFSSQDWFRGFLKTFIQGMVIEYGEKIEDFQKTLEEQSKQMIMMQERLSRTDRILKAIVSASETEYFGFPSKHMAIIDHELHKTSAYFLLKHVPIKNSVQILWDMYSQQRDSYQIWKNMILLRWTDVADHLKTRRISITYVPDPEPEDKELISEITLRDGRVYADGKVLPFLFEEFNEHK